MPSVTRGSSKIALRVQVVDRAGVVVNLEAASAVVVNLRTNRGDRHQVVATLPPHGNAGLIEAEVPDDCWRFTDWLDWQVVATYGDGRRYARKGRIVVVPPV